MRLPFAWRDYPYALTVPATAPRGVAGDFRVVSGSPQRIVARRGTTTLVFLRMDARAAARAFRRGEVDEAPVPQGDIRAAQADPVLHADVRVRQLDGIDLVAFDVAHGPLARDEGARRKYYSTPDRPTYSLLVSDGYGAPAYGWLTTGEEATGLTAPLATKPPAVPPKYYVPVVVDGGPRELYAARTAVAQWRQIGLGAEVVAAAGRGASRFERLLAPYDRPGAVLTALLLPDGAAAARADLIAALRDPKLLQQADVAAQAEAVAVPLAWIADARLVSPRLKGWTEDALGAVDYAAIR